MKCGFFVEYRTESTGALTGGILKEKTLKNRKDFFEKILVESNFWFALCLELYFYTGFCIFLSKWCYFCLYMQLGISQKIPNALFILEILAPAMHTMYIPILRRKR